MRFGHAFPGWIALSLAAHAAAFGVVVRHARSNAGAAEVAPAPPVLAGDTLEVPGLEALSEESAVDLDSEPAPTERANEGASEPKAPPRHAPKLTVHGAPSPASGGKGGDAEPARFGAVGERSAVDLATAFTRGFPQAASADPVWHNAAFGPAGAVDVVLALDDTGHLVEARLEPGGTPALRQALARTIALIRGRTFTSKKATTRLRVVGHVSADAVRDDAHGGDVVFAIGGSFLGRSGSAFFSLSSGRRIDVTVTER